MSHGAGWRYRRPLVRHGDCPDCQTETLPSNGTRSSAAPWRLSRRGLKPACDRLVVWDPPGRPGHRMTFRPSATRATAGYCKKVRIWGGPFRPRLPFTTTGCYSGTLIQYQPFHGSPGETRFRALRALFRLARSLLQWGTRWTLASSARHSNAGAGIVLGSFAAAALW
jgi:hypothetical protein